MIARMGKDGMFDTFVDWRRRMVGEGPIFWPVQAAMPWAPAKPSISPPNLLQRSAQDKGLVRLVLRTSRFGAGYLHLHRLFVAPMLPRLTKRAGEKKEWRNCLHVS